MVKLLLTKELGRLAKWLRILGFDAEYYKQGNAASLIIQALKQERIILTRNHRLPASRGVKIVILKTQKLKEQLSEALRELKAEAKTDQMFSRCTICNKELVGIDKKKIKENVPEYVYNTQENFFICSVCNRIYWQGTHWGNVETILKEIQ
jgi:hypothetical protein